MARPSRLLVGDMLCQIGLPPVEMSKEQVLELEEIARRPRKNTITADMMPDWFCTLMRGKNPTQPLAHKLPFKLAGFTLYGVLEPDQQKEHDTRVRKLITLPVAHARLKTAVDERHAMRDAIQKKMDEKQPLSPEEQEFVNKSNEGTFSKADRSEYRRDAEKKVKELAAPAPRSAREMRVEVERLCKKYAYSPVEALIQIAVDPPKDDEGKPLIGLDERIAIHKMLLPYTAPQMSSVRVSDNTGGNMLVQISQFQFTPQRRVSDGTPVDGKSPVADPNNNDIGDAWKGTIARKTAVELLQTQATANKNPRLLITSEATKLPPPTVPVDPPPAEVKAAVQNSEVQAVPMQSLADPESREWTQ